jgi:rhamnosyltransferase
MMHHMGDAGIRIGNRFRPIHRSPLRHYHIVRNTLWLQRCRYIPLKWRMQELIKLAYRAPVYVVVSSDRRATLRSLAKALTAGIGAPRRVTGWSA